MARRIVTVTVLVVALVALWRYWPSDERQIQRLVQEIAGAVQPGVDETDIARLGRLAPLARALAADVVVEGPTPVRGRDQVMAVAMQGGRAAPRLSIVVRDVEIQVEPGRATATALVTVAISGGTTGGWDDITELLLDLTRRDDVWTVTRVAPVAALRP
jgi:SnoaL-like domain